ncbi:hypothetical protein [Clostridium magnum]|uniref:Uncharacterized protein n=1 Tax=Clostridium magnum DSM 2767 TaxID=1121326 RepID=A0A162TS53_9CLOT|nr:hypothetical protein [Clostridium magnum]KZL92987.1 hypothetical protein CLMAG_28010 [Clostridium magnum DSM 2767]SHJ22452.1 hypothetical protein SAMN02745944_05570 [Clostridium magnum DSM 2767]
MKLSMEFIRILMIIANVFFIVGLTKIVTLVMPAISGQEHCQLRKDIKEWVIALEVFIGILCIAVFVSLR